MFDGHMREQVDPRPSRGVARRVVAAMEQLNADPLGRSRPTEAFPHLNQKPDRVGPDMNWKKQQRDGTAGDGSDDGGST